MRAILTLCLLCLTGCGQAKTLPKDIVAKVNHYMITTDDFKREITSSWPVLQNYPNIPPSELKAKILDAMITNQLLLEEAQKMNVDKKPAFMREVENYWRQALLKTLLEKKNAEFLSEDPATDAALKALYAREGERLELDMVTLADEATARELSAAGPVFEETIKTLGTKVVSRPGASWWSSGDFSDSVEERIWSLKVPEVSPALFSPGDGWIVAKVIAKEKVDRKPFEQMAGALRRRIARQTLPAKMDRWIGELRARARIVSNQEALDKIKLNAVQPAGGNNGK